ncbi:MAG: hypothetical protein ACHRXM_00770 [Isosphaerales bacterium]
MIKTCVHTFGLFGWGIVLTCYDWERASADGSLDIMPIVGLLLVYLLSGVMAGVMMKSIIRRNETARRIMDGSMHTLHQESVDQIQITVTFAALATGLFMAAVLSAVLARLAYHPTGPLAGVHLRPSWMTAAATFVLTLLAAISAAPIVHKKLLAPYSVRKMATIIRSSSLRGGGWPR